MTAITNPERNGLSPRNLKLRAYRTRDQLRGLGRGLHRAPGDLSGAYSRRITIQHRLGYQGLKKARTAKVLRLWTHYESRNRICGSVNERRPSQTCGRGAVP